VLIDAAANGHADCVRLLLAAGADKEARNDVRQPTQSLLLCLNLQLLLLQIKSNPQRNAHLRMQTFMPWKSWQRTTLTIKLPLSPHTHRMETQHLLELLRMVTLSVFVFFWRAGQKVSKNRSVAIYMSPFQNEWMLACKRFITIQYLDLDLVKAMSVY
jgi:hypothetical protein